MQDLPDGHIGNPEMTSDILHIGARFVLHQIQNNLLIFRHSYSSLTLLCAHDDGSTIGHLSCMRAEKEWLGVHHLG
ncbi:hypothetical protein TNCV_2104701 [Trichonephila clavipes]|nr:hypothetical protein TNCV_2104701 [Trichonephila clavipes]